MAILLGFLFLLVSSASATYCDRCAHWGRATHTPDTALASGACGYGPLALGFNDGYLTGAFPSLFKNGAGCGACFQVRCKNKALCSSKGTTVILTDQHGDSQTAFVLSSKAFMAMAKQGKAQEVLKLGVVDVEYKRIPCHYKNPKLALMVEKQSNKPYYLAVKVLYQGGQTEIVAIEVAQIWSNSWTAMARSYGAVWDTNKVPRGALKFRFTVTAGQASKNQIVAEKVLPANWEVGVIYDTGVQITDVAKENCSPCDYTTWK